MTVASEVSALFGTSTPSTSRHPAESSESFAMKAERLCRKLLSGTLTQESSSKRRSKRRISTPIPRVKQWTKNVVLIDYQGQEMAVLYDYQKLFDGLIQISSDMSEEDIREEIVRLIQLKKIPTHKFEELTTDSFSFVKVVNRKVRPLDGDVPCDGKGLPHTFKSGNVYVRLNDDSLWVKKVNIFNCTFLMCFCRVAINVVFCLCRGSTHFSSLSQLHPLPWPAM